MEESEPDADAPDGDNDTKAERECVTDAAEEREAAADAEPEGERVRREAVPVRETVPHADCVGDPSVDAEVEGEPVTLREFNGLRDPDGEMVAAGVSERLILDEEV